MYEEKQNKNISLLGKWMKTINASSFRTRAQARFMARKLGLSEVEYRKVVRKLRKKIKTVEEQMSARKWGDIDYSAVPSQASRIYRNAFLNHDKERYEKFIEKVSSGEEKINTKTLYPYQVYDSVKSDYSRSLDVMWDNLPDYTQGKNALIVADVSGSMMGRPMSVSVSLALYFAERNKGQFQNYFITFSGKPKLQKIEGERLRDRMYSIERAEWGWNTNIQAVFDLILDSAVSNDVNNDEMPETIYIVSDMEFDECAENVTNLEEIDRKYKDAGYTKPNLVFWNVDARSGRNLPVQKDERGVTLVSGFSPTVFQMAVEGKTPLEVMEETINSERYQPIKL